MEVEEKQEEDQMDPLCAIQGCDDYGEYSCSICSKLYCDKHLDCCGNNDCNEVICVECEKTAIKDNNTQYCCKDCYISDPDAMVECCCCGEYLGEGNWYAYCEKCKEVEPYCFEHTKEYLVYKSSPSIFQDIYLCKTCNDPKKSNTSIKRPS